MRRRGKPVKKAGSEQVALRGAGGLSGRARPFRRFPRRGHGDGAVCEDLVMLGDGSDRDLCLDRPGGSFALQCAGAS